jgi:hypothetical protein
MQRVSGAVSPRMKRQEHEAGHSTLPSANGGAVPLSPPYTSSWGGFYLIKPRDTFAFTLLVKISLKL